MPRNDCPPCRRVAIILLIWLCGGGQTSWAQDKRTNEVDVVTVKLDLGLSVCRSVAFSPEGKLLASCGEDGSVKLWNVANGKIIRTLDGHDDYVRSVATTKKNSSRWLASGSDDRTAKIWDLNNAEAALTLEGHTDWVTAVAFSPDGKRLASRGEDRAVKVWNLQPIFSED